MLLPRCAADALEKERKKERTRLFLIEFILQSLEHFLEDGPTTRCGRMGEHSLPQSMIPRQETPIGLNTPITRKRKQPLADLVSAKPPNNSNQTRFAWDYTSHRAATRFAT